MLVCINGKLKTSFVSQYVFFSMNNKMKNNSVAVATNIFLDIPAE